MPVEIEAKFSIPDLQAFQRLLDAETLAGFVLSQGRLIQVHDTYLDTATRRLMSAGYLCRQRVQDDRVTMTLKALAGGDGVIHRREELEVVLAEALPLEQWPASPARERVLALLEAEPLEPLLALQQARFVRLLSAGERVIAECSLDRVQLAAGARREPYLVFEVELVSDGRPEDLAVVVEVLLREWGLLPEPRSKLQAALSFLETSDAVAGSAVLRSVETAVSNLAALPPTPGVQADDPMPEAVRKVLLFHFQRMLCHEPGVCLGEDIERVHDMRVATRRMRAALSVFGDYLDGNTLRPILKDLRLTGRALGQVRDLDVFHEKLQHYLAVLPPDERPDLRPLLAAWAAEHARARAQLLAYLNGKSYAAFVTAFDALLRSPEAWRGSGLSPDGSPRPYRVRHIAPVSLYQGLAAIRAYDEWLSGEVVPVERLHQLRIASKRLRYTCEFLREIFDPRVETLIADTRRLQDHLGDVQDAVVAIKLLQAFLEQGRWAAHVGKPGPALPAASPVVAPGVRQYQAARQAELERLVAAFPEIWARFQSPEFGALAADMVAAL